MIDEKQLGRRAVPPAVVCGDMNLLRCFDDTAIPTVLVAWDPDEATLHSRRSKEKHVITPPTSEGALSDLIAIAEAHPSQPVLYYGTDDLLLLISRNRKRLSKLFAFCMPSSELIEALVDKNQFDALARKHGLPVPPGLVGGPDTTAREILDAVGLPCVFKPSCHIGWLHSGATLDGKPRKALRADGADEVAELLEHVKKHAASFVVQRFIPGGEDRILSYHAYVDDRGRVLGEFTGKKIRTYPMEAGVSTFLELSEDTRVLELGRTLVERLGMIGPLKVDFKEDEETGELFILEVNPRFTLWNFLGSRCGVNLPELAYGHLTGARVEPQQPHRVDVRWLSFGNDLRAFLRDYRPSGELTVGEWLKSYRAPLVYDIFSWSDPLPFGASMMSYAKAVWQKVRQQAA